MRCPVCTQEYLSRTSFASSGLCTACAKAGRSILVLGFVVSVLITLMLGRGAVGMLFAGAILVLSSIAAISSIASRRSTSEGWLGSLIPPASAYVGVLRLNQTKLALLVGAIGVSVVVAGSVRFRGAHADMEATVTQFVQAAALGNIQAAYSLLDSGVPREDFQNFMASSTALLQNFDRIQVSDVTLRQIAETGDRLGMLAGVIIYEEGPEMGFTATLGQQPEGWRLLGFEFASGDRQANSPRREDINELFECVSGLYSVLAQDAIDLGELGWDATELSLGWPDEHEPYPEIAFEGANPDSTTVLPEVIAEKTADYAAQCFRCAGYSALLVEFLPETESDEPYGRFLFDLQELLDSRGEPTACPSDSG